jgi:O-antigen ligase
MEFGQLFTWALALAGTGYGWAAPIFGLMAFYAFAVLRPIHLWFWAFDEYNAPRFSLWMGISTLAGWAMASFGDWGGMKHIKWPMFGLVLYLISGAYAAQFHSIYAPRAWEFWEIQFKICIMILVAGTLILRPRDLRIFAWVLTASLCYLAWVFNSQYYFDGWNRVYIRGFGGIDNNGTGMIMVMGVPLAFFMGMNDKRLWVKGLCFVGVACCIHVVLFSFSRGAQLGLVLVGLATFIVIFIGLPNKVMTTIMALAFLCFAIYFAGAEVRDEFWSMFVDRNELDASAASRFETWGAAWACMLDNPWGVGPRNFNLISNQYGLPPNKSVHNLFLQTGADYGFGGMIGLAIFYVGTMWQTFWMSMTRTARRLGWPRYFGHMVSISLGGFLVCSTFIGMESVEVGYIIGGLGLCTVAFVRRTAESEPAAELGVLPELEHVPAADADVQFA